MNHKANIPLQISRYRKCTLWTIILTMCMIITGRVDSVSMHTSSWKNQNIYRQRIINASSAVPSCVNSSVVPEPLDCLILHTRRRRLTSERQFNSFLSCVSGQPQTPDNILCVLWTNFRQIVINSSFCNCYRSRTSLYQCSNLQRSVFCLDSI